MPVILAKSLMCSTVGIASLIPVTLFLPCSTVSTRPAPTGSVTVPKTTGVSLSVVERAIATGVAMPTATSTFFTLYCEAICAAVFTSPFAF